MAMTRSGARAARGRVARALGIEPLEGRRLLSAIGPTPIPSEGASAFAAIPLPVLVSRVSLAAPGSLETAEGVGTIRLGDGSIAPVTAGRATITAPAPSPSDHAASLAPSVSAVNVVGLRESMSGAPGDFVAIDPGIGRLFSVQGAGPTTAVAVDGSGLGAASTQAGGEVTLADSAVADPPSPGVVAAWPTVPGGTFISAERSGAVSLAGNTSAVSFAVASLPGLPLPAGVDATYTSGAYGQVTITSVGFSGGEASLANGVFMKAAAIAAPQFLWLNPGDATIPAPSPAASLVTSGTIGLAPLFVDVADGSPRSAAVVANGLAATAGSGNAAALVEIGLASLATTGPSACPGGRPGQVLAADSSPAPAGRGLAPMANARDIHGRRDLDAGVAIDLDWRTIATAVGQIGLGDLRPERLGPILDFRPFDRVALEQTIDRFLGQLEGLGSEWSTLRVSMDVAAELLVLAVALAAWRVVPRMRRRPASDRGTMAFDDATTLDGISGLAGGPSPEIP